MPAKIGKFKGHNVISLVSKDADGKERLFTFGLKKARLIMENLDDIKVFVEKGE